MKSRRGITTIVATVFLIAVVVSSLTYITYSLELMANFSEQLVTEETRKKNVQDEAFELIFVNMTDAVTPTVFKLDATIENTGEIPLKITTLWLDKQNENDVVRKIPIDITIAPGRTFNLIDENIDIDVDSDAGYSMKFVTTRGETQTFFLNSAGTESLDIELTAIPETIPDGFTSTIIMTVVNNMTNNRELHNLTPNDPICADGCIEISGPIPPTYKSLKPGDVATFRWVYELTDTVGDTFTFTSSLVGGVPENTDSTSVTIGNILNALSSGQAISASGFGSQNAAPDSFILHIETGSIPALADYQMSLTSPDDTGTPFIFPTDGNVKQWFSANQSGIDVTVPAGNWNASLRYNSPRLPSGMDSAASDIHDNSNDGGGHTLHFNTNEVLARKDSGQLDNCTDLVDSGTLSGANWYADRGVNGSGAYHFDGNDYISITNSGAKKDCNYLDNQSGSIAGWFNATSGGGNSQAIYSKYDTGEGGYEASLENGNVEFTFIEEGASDFVKCTTSGTDYRDNKWHHFAGVLDIGNKECTLYVDDITPVTDSDGGLGHEHEEDDDIFIGMRGGSTNGFEGYLDDIMWWNNYILTADDVAALRGYSFGENATRMNFFINNATGPGVTLDNLATSLDYGLPWSDQFDNNVDYSWMGGNYTVSMPQVTLHVENENRLNFTMSYSSGEPLNLMIDESELDGMGTTPLSSYLQTQTPLPPGNLPTYLYFVNDERRVELFIYNAGDEGAWLTYQGTRVIFNGTNGHYAGLVDTIDDGIAPITLTSDQDGPFIPANAQADIDFHHPKHAPTVVTGGGQVPLEDRIPVGFYGVTIYLNGYDETGGIIVRSLDMGLVEVIAP